MEGFFLMLEQLKILLRDAVIDEGNVQVPSLIQFKTEENEVIYFNKDKLTTEQLELLHVFLIPVEDYEKMDTTKETFWRKLIEKGEVTSNNLTVRLFRFYHFFIYGKDQNKQDFSEAISSIFQNELAVVWLSSNQGVLVEYIFNDEEEVFEASVVEAIMSDLFVKLSIFQGRKFTLEDGKKVYDWEESIFSLGRKMLPKQQFLTQEQLIPFLIANETSPMTKSMLLESLKPFKEDKELLTTIKVFFQSNLNTTLAAKKLYMHRNSVQYRIDKFIEKTGIDIKQFQHAAAMYMILILEEVTHKHE